MHTSQPDIGEILSHFDGVKQSGPGKWVARCPVPAHGKGRGDKHPSLSISIGEKQRIVLHCHAGCTMLEILRAAGLKLSDVMTECRRQPRIVETYPYHTQNGEVLYEVVRLEPKSFRMRRPDGNGNWTWKLGGTPRILYRLPDIAKAEPEEWVFIVEGEKDADRLASLGLVATCNPGGAGKWRYLADDSILAGRKIAIIADNDSTGRQHAKDVAARLAGRAAEVRLLDLPGEANDVSEWLETGGSAETLRDLVESASASGEALEQEPEVSPLNGEPTPGTEAMIRPQIQGNKRQLREIRADAVAALKARNDPPRLFLYGGNLVRVVHVRNDRNEPVPTVQALDADAMRGELTDAADWFKLTRTRDGSWSLVPDLPPKEVACDLLALRDPDWPRLTGLITCPTFAPDGSLILDNGYHAASGLWLEHSIADLPAADREVRTLESQIRKAAKEAGGNGHAGAAAVRHAAALHAGGTRIGRAGGATQRCDLHRRAGRLRGIGGRAAGHRRDGPRHVDDHALRLEHRPGPCRAAHDGLRRLQARDHQRNRPLPEHALQHRCGQLVGL